MTIKTQLLTVLLVLTIIPFVLVPYVGYIYVKSNIEKQLMLQSEQNMNQIIKDMDQIMDDLVEVSNAIYLNENIINGLKYSDNTAGIISATGELSKINASLLYTYSADISLFLPDGQYYISTGLFDVYNITEIKKQWIKDTQIEGDFFVWNYDNSGENKNATLCMLRSIKDDRNEVVGISCIELLPERKINSLLKHDNEFENTERYIVDENGKIIYQYQENEDGLSVYQDDFFQVLLLELEDEAIVKLPYENSIYVVSYDILSRNQWGLVQIIPYKDLIQDITYFRNYTIAIDLLFLLLLIGIDVIIIDKITLSIRMLRDSMKEVRKGDFVTIEVLRTNQEVQELAIEFNHMTKRLDELFQENIKINEEKQRTRLLALQTQIQPHFLFNTLNGVKWLCTMNESKRAEAMLVSLGRILEYALSRNQDVATLEQEAECLVHYMILQKMRYGDIFEFKIELDEAVKQCEVPVLFLQPLIENSILHGMVEKQGDGIIYVRAIKTEGQVWIDISDNGIGMTLDRLEKINNPNEMQVGMGIRNVIERIEIYYNTKGSMNMELNKMGGITTRIVIPIVRNTEIGEEVEDFNCR